MSVYNNLEDNVSLTLIATGLKQSGPQWSMADQDLQPIPRDAVRIDEAIRAAPVATKPHRLQPIQTVDKLRK
jgi:hypothetical protein